MTASFNNCIIVHSNWAEFQKRQTALLIIFPSELKKKKLFKGRVAQFLTKTEGVRKRYGLMEFIYFLMIIYQKKKVYILRPCREIVLSFQESLREDKLVKNLKIISMGRCYDNILLALYNVSDRLQRYHQ